MQEKAIRSIRRVCAAGLDSVTLRRELMRHVARVVAYDAFAFSTCDPDTGLMTHTVAENVPRVLGRVYVERIYPDKAAAEMLDFAERGPSLVSRLQATTDVDGAFSAEGVKAHLHVAYVADGRMRGTSCLMRTELGLASMQRAASFFERIAPLVARGLKSAGLVDEAGVPDAAESPPNAAGVLVLDARGRPLVRTPAATRWLADLADIGAGTAEGLPLSVLAVATRVRRMRADVADEVTVRLRGRSGRWYTLRASLAEPDVSGMATTVIVIRPVARREIAPFLTQLYGLSPREREVVAAVARGEPTKCIAATLGVSPYTVEEHLERACRKIGVRGRKALVAKIFVEGYASRVVAGQANTLRGA